MAQSAERLLMNEFKALSKETWTNIEVSRSQLRRGGGVVGTRLTSIAHQRERL
jgi:hypothetical protein